ncbi:potassium-transporting ATPase potassium-binding subunit [Thermogymnomonas acidicola]|uniref:Potassium-transporting ATPase potassium-binding subunit n=1 Tax=Thermogymnomonas acidicola TaxID=399579 RepID=A0AA37FA13_9ARCH|nr:potassium-transporting ATPase subunit KdpA [Thermogymnomonas acidicola]GGM79128.1 potassium-transporting ATPase potassium-binding subunit [Thermogymnomonas acidicola]
MSFWTQLFLENRLLSGSLIILIYLLIVSVSAYLFSGHIAKVYREERTVLHGYSSRAIALFERMLGPVVRREMRLREYLEAVLLVSAFAGTVCFLLLVFQRDLPFSYANNHMTVSLAFNTVTSFLTNTDLQHYSNPFDLTYFSTTFVIIGLMFFSPTLGFAVSMAFIRGILTDKGHLGNFYHDFLVAFFEVVLPATLVVTALLIALGVPETVHTYLLVTPFFSKGAVKVPLGPVASLEAIKNIGTNGGGFYGANAGYPFEDPDWATNIVEYVSFNLIPMASILSLGRVFESRKFGLILYSVIMAFYLFSAYLSFFGEYFGVPQITSLGTLFTGNMLGKETAIGLSQSTIFQVGATMTSTGAANGSIISYTPAGVLGILIPLLLNDPLGGVGTSVLNIFTYVIFTMFISSLMVGKLPELLTLKIGSKEIRYSTLSLVTHPLLVIVPFGITLMLPGVMSTFVNSRPDQITQLLYEFATSAANNGSEMGGFATNSPYFNYLDGVIMLLGRYLLIGFQLVIAYSFSTQKAKVQGERAIDPGTKLFGFLLFSVMLLIGLLSFFPMLVLGPILSWAKLFNFEVLKWSLLRI